MNETIIIFPAFLKSFRTLVDGSISVSFDVNKTDPDKIGKIVQAHQKVGYLAFKVGETEGKLQQIMEQLPQQDLEHGKTKGQRLRAVFYRLWEQDSKGYDVFDDFYNHHMELLINQIKDRLE